MRDKPSTGRLFVIFLFGLLHGLGFASVLGELSPSGDQWLARSIGFNVGVEIGQLVVVAAAFLALALWRGRDWYRPRIVVPLSVIIALIGAFWTVERVLASFA